MFSLPAEQFNKLNTNGVNRFSGRGLVSYIPNQLTIRLLLKQNAKFLTPTIKRMKTSLFSTEISQHSQDKGPIHRRLFIMLSIQRNLLLLPLNEQGVIRRFTTDNPVIPDDEFVSPIRRFNQADQYSPD